MKYKIEEWPISQLLQLLAENKLNLNPPYQRNAIWTKKTQKFLIHSIKTGVPIPTIFLFEKEPYIYEMVDGQQRTRALHLYNSTNEIDLSEDDNTFKTGGFLSYRISVTIITEIENDESIEDFYFMVNSSGVKLNRPETLKAQYFEKRFLKLVEDLNKDDLFINLEIIPGNSQKRMMDRDLIEELCALIISGITDKKHQVDKLYERDITQEEGDLCRSKFLEILQHLNRFNQLIPIKTTRFRQRNDFYTLFGFLKDNSSISIDTLDYFYKLLVILERGIRPSLRTTAKALAEYAFNCVSQSNSATARVKRLEIFNNLLLNIETSPNADQESIKEFYPSGQEYFNHIDGYFTFNAEVLNQAITVKEANN